MKSLSNSIIENIVLHQMNSKIGDIEGNVAKMISLIKDYGTNRIHVFPETAVTGYLCGSLYDRLDFVKEAHNATELIKKTFIKELSSYDLTIIFGNITYHGINEAGFPIIRNSVILLNGDNTFIYDKQLLANGDHHEDRKYFEAGTETKVFEIRTNSFNYETIKIGLPICEDCWFTDHKRNIPEEMCNMGADLLISINQSYFAYGKQLKKYNLFSSIAKHNNVPVIMLNNVGCGDVVKNIVTYPGGSMVFDDNGKLISNLPLFQEISKIISIDDKLYSWNLDKNEEILKDLIYTQKEFFSLQNISKAQVHMSGGLDSAIVGYIVAKAMGENNTIFITNPSSLNGEETKSNAKYISEKLNIELFWEPIQATYIELLKADDIAFGLTDHKQKPTGYSSMQAVLRTVMGLAANHRFGSAIVNTGNHTENVLSWFSFSDIGSTGIYQPLGDLTKVELFYLAEYINNVIEGDIVIPENLYNGELKPAAELPDAKEDPIDYWVLSGICAELVRNRKSIDDLMFSYDNNLLNTDLFPKQDEIYKYSRDTFKNLVIFASQQMKKSVYKCAQSSPIAIISPRSRGFSDRETLINFYNK